MASRFTVKSEPPPSSVAQPVIKQEPGAAAPSRFAVRLAPPNPPAVSTAVPVKVASAAQPAVKSRFSVSFHQPSSASAAAPPPPPAVQPRPSPQPTSAVADGYSSGFVKLSHQRAQAPSNGASASVPPSAAIVQVEQREQRDFSWQNQNGPQPSEASEWRTNSRRTPRKKTASRSKRQARGSSRGESAAGALPLNPDGSLCNYYWFHEGRSKALVYNGRKYKGRSAGAMWKKIKTVQEGAANSNRNQSTRTKKAPAARQQSGAAAAAKDDDEDSDEDNVPIALLAARRAASKKREPRAREIKKESKATRPKRTKSKRGSSSSAEPDRGTTTLGALDSPRSTDDDDSSSNSWIVDDSSSAASSFGSSSPDEDESEWEDPAEFLRLEQEEEERRKMRAISTASSGTGPTRSRRVATKRPRDSPECVVIDDSPSCSQPTEARSAQRPTIPKPTLLLDDDEDDHLLLGRGDANVMQGSLTGGTTQQPPKTQCQRFNPFSSLPVGGQMPRPAAPRAVGPTSPAQPIGKAPSSIVSFKSHRPKISTDLPRLNLVQRQPALPMAADAHGARFAMDADADLLAHAEPGLGRTFETLGGLSTE